VPQNIRALFAVSIACLLPPSLSDAATAPPLPVASSPEAMGFSSARLGSLDAEMRKAVTSGQVMGLQYVLARHGLVVSNHSYGHLSEGGGVLPDDAIFRIYSMSKPVTGVAMMILFEQGKWRLDDPVTKYLPELKGLKVFKGLDDKGQPRLEPAKRAPTMRELMSHSAGFGYGISDQDPVDRMLQEKRVLESAGLNDLVAKVAATPLLYQPGENWSYSIAVDLQGAIVERLSGQTLGQFMHDQIFAPLKMVDTGFLVSGDRADRLASVYYEDPQTHKLVEARETADHRAVQDYTKPPVMESGGGGLVSTTRDYARFAQMLANRGQLDGARILSPASVALMGVNVVPAEVRDSATGILAERLNRHVGFGLDVEVEIDARQAGSLEGDGTMSWGGAAGTWFWVDPTNDVVFVGMIQRFGRVDDIPLLARTLVYQALVDPKK